MKKILLMSLLCLTIVACGKKEEAKQEAAETTNVTQEQDYGAACTWVLWVKYTLMFRKNTGPCTFECEVH